MVSALRLASLPHSATSLVVSAEDIHSVIQLYFLHCAVMLCNSKRLACNLVLSVGTWLREELAAGTQKVCELLLLAMFRVI